MIAFIDDHRDVHGVEPICRLPPLAPSTYHAHIAARRDFLKRSIWAKRDDTPRAGIECIHTDNFNVYGVRKM